MYLFIHFPLTGKKVYLKGKINNFPERGPYSSGDTSVHLSVRATEDPPTADHHGVGVGGMSKANSQILALSLLSFIF